MRVLLVDDSAPVRVRLHAMIAEADPGIEIREASGAREALEAAREGVDVVVLDLHLGEETGLSVLDALRRLAPEAEVIVLTNAPSTHHRRECETRGARGFFDKSREFEQAVALVVERAHARRSSRR